MSRQSSRPAAKVGSASSSIDKLVASKEIVITCGSGGVGKTTTAAAIAAMAAVNHGGKVLVLTVDPARRLANAMGISSIGNKEARIPDEAFVEAGERPRGELWAAMLDTKQSWDDLVLQHSPDKESSQRILANPIYQNFSGRFVQSHDYIAMERLYELHRQGGYDLIVVDTPPTRNAIDFLEAPQRMEDFFSSRLLRWLTVPYRSKLMNVASKPFYQVADRILGTQFLEDIAEFFMLFQSMYDGFVERSRTVARLLKDKRTTFMVVSTLEAAPLREGEYFIEELTARKFHLGAVVLNKVLPGYLKDAPSIGLAKKMSEEPESIAIQLDSAFSNRDLVTRVIKEIADSYLNYSLVAKREEKERAELAVAPDHLCTVPFMETDIYDLAGLLKVGNAIWG